MKDVSTRVVHAMTQSLCAIEHISPETLLDGGPLALELIKDPRKWIEWESFIQWIEWLEQSRYGPVEWEKVGEGIHDVTALPLANAFSRVFLDSKFAYWMGARWLGPSLMRPIRNTYEDLPNGQVREVLFLPAPYLECHLLFRVFEGTLRSVPKKIFNQPEAIVEMNYSARQTTYLITPPPPRSGFVCLFRLLFSQFYLKRMMNEMVYQQEQLGAQYSDLLGARRELQHFLENSPNGIMAIRDGKLVYANSALVQALGLQNTSQLIGKPWIDLLHPSDRERFGVSFENSLRVRGLECRLLRGNGKIGSFELFPLANAIIAGGPALPIVVRDLTEARLTEQILAASSKMSLLGELAANIAHEVSNPLSVVRVNAYLLLEHLESKQPDPQFLASTIKGIEGQCLRMATILTGLKNFSRHDHLDPFTPASADKLVLASLALCRSKFEQHGIVASFSKTSPLLTLDCHPTEIEQVLVNLLTNAADAVSELPTKTIEIEVHSRQDSVEFRVTDSGPGVPHEIIDSVFEPFFTTKGAGKGTGLGLAITKRIVEGHKGSVRIEADSTHTCFVVLLPKTQPPGP